MNQLMQSPPNAFWSQWPSPLWSGVDEFAPLADIEETDDAYVLELELPGVAKADIDIEVSGRRLVVRGERKEKERTGILRHRTRAVGRFRYEVVLPGEIDERDVKATMADGELTIRAAKTAAERPRRIKIN
jgi:HSP20 family protein